MAIKTREELLASINARFGEDTSDEALAFIEDVTDTLTDMENKATGDNWKQKYEDNDKAWRKKYHDRFFGASDDEDPDPDPEDKGKPLTFEMLFKEE